MRHCDDETLSLLALGEPVNSEVSAHVSGCPRCTGELQELRAVVDGIRPDLPVVADVVPVTPPRRVWEGIAAATGVQSAPRATPAEAAADRLVAPEGPADPDPTASDPADPDPAASDPAEPRVPAEATPVARPSPAAPVVPGTADDDRPRLPRQRSAPPRRGPGRAMMLALAASFLVLGLVAGVAGTLLLRPVEPTAPAPERTAIAATRLDPLPTAPSASGQAQVVQVADGRRLDIDVARLGAAEGFYQVWLIDPTVKKMVPVGVLRGDHGEFALPSGVKLQDYPIVDVSVEPLDGNPTHSGKSVLRGTIRS